MSLGKLVGPVFESISRPIGVKVLVRDNALGDFGALMVAVQSHAWVDELCDIIPTLLGCMPGRVDDIALCGVRAVLDADS